MRTTVVLDADVAAAIERLRAERSIGLSKALNTLVRTGLRAKSPRHRFVQRSQPIGLRIDVTNIAETLEQLDGPAAR
jgi:hypothetical protein